MGVNVSTFAVETSCFAWYANEFRVNFRVNFESKTCEKRLIIELIVVNWKPRQNA